MNLIKWQPMDEMLELGRLLNNSFDRNGYPPRARKLKLALDIYETEDNLILRAALPGAKKEDITVEFEEQLLTVTAEVQSFEAPEGAQPLLAETATGKVTRTLRVPHRLDVEKSKGTFVDGVLEVTFPKAEEARKKSITIE